MKKVSFIVRNDPALINNKIFSGQPLYGMKSDNYPFVALKQELAKSGISFDTFDLSPPSQADLVVCLDEVEIFKQHSTKGIPSLLIISEPPVYVSANWDIKNHNLFDKVFTYNKDLVTTERYEHYFFPIEFEYDLHLRPVSESDFKKRKTCAMVAGAIQSTKVKKTNNSLLYERYKTLRWFSRNHPEDFDFYGRNVKPDKFSYFSGAGILKRLGLTSVVNFVAQYYAKPVFKVYKGEIPSLKKIEYLNGYNFTICYENSSGINGCISEKIFDCFAAGNVPIYWGAPNIEEYIPSSCFIDRRNFKNHAELYTYIKNMSYREYSQYLLSAQDFLLSKEIDKFKVDSYVSLITSNIFKYINFEKGNFSL